MSSKHLNTFSTFTMYRLFSQFDTNISNRGWTRNCQTEAEIKTRNYHNQAKGKLKVAVEAAENIQLSYRGWRKLPNRGSKENTKLSNRGWVKHKAVNRGWIKHTVVIPRLKGKHKAVNRGWKKHTLVIPRVEAKMWPALWNWVRC